MSLAMVGPDWESLELVAFDVDGTLYRQGRLRRRMMVELAIHCLIHPGDLVILRIITAFRRERERLAEEGADRVGERQFSRPAQRLGIGPEEVRTVVEHWMEQRPLPHLRACRYAEIDSFMRRLRSNGKIVAVWSDYPTHAKISALGLQVDLHASAVDTEIDRLKPHPRGLEWLLERAGVRPERAILIGDRHDRDGECARRASMRCLIKTRSSSREEGEFAEFGELLSRL